MGENKNRNTYKPLTVELFNEVCNKLSATRSTNNYFITIITNERDYSFWNDFLKHGYYERP